MTVPVMKRGVLFHPWKWVIERAPGGGWRILPPKHLYVSDKADIEMFGTGAGALAAFNAASSLTSNVTGRPSGGTWTWNVFHGGTEGVSDPIAWNATGADAHAGFLQACERAQSG